MSEPTKEAIECSSDEARRLAAPHSYTRVTTRIPIVREIVFTQYGLAQFITQLRKQAREDALEAAIVTGGIWVQAAYIAQFNASLRALKTQGDTQ